MSNKSNKTKKDLEVENQKLNTEVEDLKTQLKRVDFANKSVFDVVNISCGFAPPDPNAEDGLNEGAALLIIKADGSYDLICSYYNDSCRNDCQVKKIIADGNQNFDLDDSLFKKPDDPEYEDEDEDDFEDDFEDDE